MPNLWNSTYAACPGGQGPCTTNVVQQPGSYSYGNQGFISQRNLINWGRAPYAAGENGGIQGTVVYSSTRPFDDQRYNIQTIWEPLVPRVTVNLYQQTTLSDGTTTLTLVDTTQTSSWDDWANTVYGADGKPYILEPGPDPAQPRRQVRLLPRPLIPPARKSICSARVNCPDRQRVHCRRTT